jgi:hypothetical protein
MSQDGIKGNENHGKEVEQNQKEDLEGDTGIEPGKEDR